MGGIADHTDVVVSPLLPWRLCRATPSSKAAQLTHLSDAVTVVQGEEVTQPRLYNLPSPLAMRHTGVLFLGPVPV